MKSYWLAIKKKYWESRSHQEQKVLKIAAWVITPVLVYFVLWQPAHTDVQKLHASIPVLSVDAERLRNQAIEVERLRHSPKPAVLDAVALKSTVEDSALRYNLNEAISALNLQEPNAVRISFASVSFEQWMRWLRALQQEQHIRADSVSVAILPQTGMVKISATLVNGRAQ